MLDVPSEVIDMLIKEGAVFYFPEDTFATDDPHYFCVLNCDPVTEETLLLVNATSKVDERIKARSNQGLPADTLVKVGVGDCSFLTCDSVFDCNSPIIKTRQELKDKFDNGEVKLCDPMPKDILEKLRDGVVMSKLVSTTHEGIIRKKH